jgi:predicted DNA-binding transcriptional regulator AlpA
MSSPTADPGAAPAPQAEGAGPPAWLPLLLAHLRPGQGQGQAEAPAALDIRGLAALTSRSVPSLERDDLRGLIPSPIRIGRSKRWLRSEIIAWLEAGAPCRSVWEATKKARRGR